MGQEMGAYGQIAGIGGQQMNLGQQQQQPERQVAWMNQQLGALPYQNIVQQGSYAPQAGAVSNLMGAGIQGAGLWNAWQGRQAPLPQDTATTSSGNRFSGRDIFSGQRPTFQGR